MTPTIAPVVFGGLIIWSIYRRIRRNIGPQRLRPVRSIISLVIFSVLTLLLIVASLVSPESPKLLAGIGSGLLLGVALGFLGLRLTRFETTAAGHFYTPNTYIGVGLSVLFIGRMLYRFWRLQDGVAGQPQPFQSALTYLCFGLIAGYYMVYYVGLFIHTHDKVPADAS